MFGRAFGSATRGARAAFFRARLTRGLSSVKARPAFARFGAVAAFAAGAAMASSVAFAAEEKKNSQAAGPTGEVPLRALINPNEFSNLVVVFHEKVNDNTHMLVLSAPDSAHVEMPTASFVLVRVKVGDKEEVRPYTPVFCKDGLIGLMIKEYPDGVVSKHLANLPEGATVEVKGFIPKIAVTDGFKKNVGLIAGGSGITPMFQVITKLLSGDKTKISLIYANVEERDIWFKDTFDWASEQFPDKFRAVYFLEKPPAGWTGETGRVTKEALEKYLPPPSNDSLVMVCGPPGMMKAVSGPKTKDYKQGEVEGILKELGYTSDQVFKF